MRINKFSPFAIVGFVLSMLSLLVCNYAFYTLFLITIPALVFCVIGLKDRRYLKKGLAIAGLVVSVVSIQIGIFLPRFVAMVDRARQATMLEEALK